MRLRVLVLFMALMLVVSGSAAAQGTAVITPAPPPTTTPDLITSAPHGTVTGKVTNGTAAAPAPTNIAVTLLINSEGVTVVSMNTTTTADGSFQFNDVPIVDGYQYVAAASYRDHIFNSTFASGDASTTTYDLPIRIYELTEDPTVLSISGSESQVNAQGATLEVRQVLHIHNSSDRLYTTSKDLGDGRFGSVLISLPPGAQVVSLDNQTRYIVSTTNFSVLDTNPVLPGDADVIILAYIIPYDGKAAIIEQQMNYPFEGQASLLVSPDSIQVKSDQLPSAGSRPVAETVYKYYAGKLKLNVGDVIRYEISGASGVTNFSATTAARVPSTGNNTILFILTALIGVGVIATILALVLRSRQNQSARPDQLIDALTRQIALIDQKHAAGELPHDLWHQQRMPLQARLEELQGE